MVSFAQDGIQTYSVKKIIICYTPSTVAPLATFKHKDGHESSTVVPHMMMIICSVKIAV